MSRKMRFTFHIPKLGNKFFFVQNFAEWHHSNRSKDNQIWVKKTGLLSSAEKEAVSSIGKLMIKPKYGFGSKEKNVPPFENLYEPFFTLPEDQVWEKLENWMQPQELEDLKNALGVFTPRFQKIWQEEKPKLEEKQAWLSKFLEGHQPDQIVKYLVSFYQPKTVPEAVEIHLIIRADPESSAGGANLGEGRITLEISSTKDIDHLPSVVWHETAHLFQQDYVKELVSQYVEKVEIPTVWPEKTFSKHTVLREPITYTLFTNVGYLSKEILGTTTIEKSVKRMLGEDFAKIKKNPERFYLWPIFAGYQLLPLTKEYLSENRAVDEEYFNQLIAIWDEYLALVDRT